MEIVAGCAVYNGRRLWVAMPANAVELKERLAMVQQRILEVKHEKEALEKAPEHFVNEFWREFHRSMVHGTQRSTVTKIFCVALFGVLLASVPHAYAAQPLNLVIAVDLTASVAGASGIDHKTELDKNLNAVSRILEKAPAGSHVTVVGITDRSFSQPYVLLSAKVNSDEDYFKEKITAARRALVQAWQGRSATLVSHFQQTDLLGSLVVASQIFEPRAGNRNILVILSDMRHETRTLNLAKPALVPARTAVEKAEEYSLIADLHGVDVYALGVDGAGKDVAYWNSLRTFWVEYFRKAGAEMRVYSMLRDLPTL
jgi:hypothetical protein